MVEISEYIHKHRDRIEPYNLSSGAGTTDDRQADLARAQALESAGANWWLDGGNPATESLETLRARVRRGPPRS